MVKVSEVHEEDHSSSEGEDMPDLETAGQAEEVGKSGKQNRQEKKIRKALASMIKDERLIICADIMRVTVRKAKHILFVIPKPDVYKTKKDETYVIIGEARIEDLSAQAQANAAQMFSQNRPQAAAAEEAIEEVQAIEELVEETEELKLEDSDVQLVVDQTNCSKAEAIAALQKCNNDVVEAIMALSDSSA